MRKAIVLLLAVAVSSSLQHPVESEVTTVDPEPEYKFVNPFFKANWFKAVEYCHYLGLRLAIIDSEKKESKLYEAIEASDVYRKDGMRIWVGASDLAEEGEYHWHATGKPVIYTNWGDRQPDNSGQNEHCLEVILASKNLWNDRDCKAKNYFVCE